MRTFKFNYENIQKSKTKFDLSKRFNLIFSIFDVDNIYNFNTKISQIKKKAKLEDDLKKLNINLKENSEKIISGINF